MEDLFKLSGQIRDRMCQKSSPSSPNPQVIICLPLVDIVGNNIFQYFHYMKKKSRVPFLGCFSSSGNVIVSMSIINVAEEEGNTKI